MIVDIRGTHGSGKTWMVRHLMAKYVHEGGAWQLYKGTCGGEPIAYHQIVKRKRPLVVLGIYDDMPSGGVDRVDSVDIIEAMIRRFGRRDTDVVYEGAIVTTIYQRFADMARAARGAMQFVFMGAPMEKCLERVNQRRKDKGRAPLDEENTVESKFQTCLRIQAKLKAAGIKFCVMDASHETVETLYGWLEGRENRPHGDIFELDTGTRGHATEEREWHTAPVDQRPSAEQLSFL